MKKFDLSAIMCKAWKLYRKGVGSFAEALHRAWNSAKAAPINAQRIEEAQQAAGVAEPVNTWAGWKAAGYMVEHGAKALFQAVLIHSSKGDGQTYRASSSALLRSNNYPLTKGTAASITMFAGGCSFYFSCSSSLRYMH